MTHKLIITLLLASLVISSGCAALVVGAGTGAGVYTYVSGELKRSYNAPFDRAVNGSTDALQHLKITIISKKDSGIVTTINGEKSDRTPVTVTITMLGPGITEVSVRTGVVGLWDKKVSELIQAHIAKKLR